MQPYRIEIHNGSEVFVSTDGIGRVVLTVQTPRATSRLTLSRELAVELYGAIDLAIDRAESEYEPTYEQRAAWVKEQRDELDQDDRRGGVR